MKQTKEVKVCLFTLWIFVLLCNSKGQIITNSNGLNIDNDENSFEIETLSSIRTALENPELCLNADNVLIFGNRGTGQTSLITHLTDSNLSPPNLNVDARSSFAHDEPPAIGLSHTGNQVPTLTVDPATGINYYNCPSFDETRSIETDILALATTKKLLECSQRIKLLFTINLPLNRSFDVSRAEFLSMAEHAIDLIKNIAKYQRGMMLVATEFQDFYANQHGQFLFISDHGLLDRVAAFLVRVKDWLETATTINGAKKMKIAAFINVLLTKEDNEYMKIGISRLQHDPTAARNLELLFAEKQRIVSIVNYRVQYVAKDNINIALSDALKFRIRHRIDGQQKRLINDVTEIDVEIKEFYMKKEANYTDLFKFDDEIAVGLLKFSQIRPNEPFAFHERLICSMNELNISISSQLIDEFGKRIEYIASLKNATNITTSPFLIPNGLKATTKYLHNAKKWYSFIINLSDVMDRYSAQCKVNVGDIADLFAHCTTDDGVDVDINVNEIGLSKFLDRIGSDIFHTVENMRVNAHMLNALKMAVAWANKPIQLICTANKLTVIGYNVKISSLTAIDCMASATLIEIFAFNKLYIDANIDKTGQTAHISLVAPTWEIIGERKIFLSGVNGTAPFRQYADYGEHGKPGCAGGSAGHFFGIGNTFVNEQQLEVVGIGGNGGDGQHGSDGHIQSDEYQHQIIAEHLNEVSRWFQNESLKENATEFYHGPCSAHIVHKTGKLSLQVTCENGDIPQNISSNGGSGGVGGDFGKIVVIGLEQRPKICLLQKAGEMGEPGRGTFGGIDGYNSDGLQLPNVVPFHPLQSLDDYKIHMKDGRENIVRKSYFRDFLTHLSEHPSIHSLIDEYANTTTLLDLRHQAKLKPVAIAFT